MAENKEGFRELVEVGDYFVDVTGISITPETHFAIDKAAAAYQEWEKIDEKGGNKVLATQKFQKSWSEMMDLLNLPKPKVFHRSELEVEQSEKELVGIK